MLFNCQIFSCSVTKRRYFNEVTRAMNAEIEVLKTLCRQCRTIRAGNRLDLVQAAATWEQRLQTELIRLESEQRTQADLALTLQQRKAAA